MQNAHGAKVPAGVPRRPAAALGGGPGSCFDYDAFWAQLGGAPLPSGLFERAIPAPEKPPRSLKPNHRACPLRQRHYEQQLRAAVEQYCRAAWPGPSGPPAEPK